MITIPVDEPGVIDIDVSTAALVGLPTTAGIDIAISATGIGIDVEAGA